jgi:hypothetical protein
LGDLKIGRKTPWGKMRSKVRSISAGLCGIRAGRKRREALRDQIAFVAAYEPMTAFVGGGFVSGVVYGDRVALSDLRCPR